MENKKKVKLIHRLKDKYRLVIMNEDTFEEKFSITLTPLNVFVLFSSIAVLFMFLFYFLLFATPIKEYFVKGSNEDVTREIIDLQFKLDSLEIIAKRNERMLYNKRMILEDKIDTSFNNSLPKDSSISQINLDPGGLELSLRQIMEPKESYDLVRENRSNIYRKSIAPFFSPISGYVTSGYNSESGHYATDVVPGTDQTVKATLAGTVVFASWTPDAGNVIVLQHDRDILSIYKHNALILKKVGNFVDVGEAIAIVGNSGELTTGKHLHFEIWHEGMAINAQDYLVFK